jgi:hypothetical protein
MGELSMKLLAASVLSERSPAALVDGNPARHGLRFGPVAVASPGSLCGTEGPIVVGSLLRSWSIRDAIAARGLPNPVVELSAA